MDSLDFQKLLIWVNRQGESMLHGLGAVRAAAQSQVIHSLEPQR